MSASKIVPSAKRQCSICNEQSPKYKCPTCLIQYCSLACFKKHKETRCSKPESQPPSPVKKPPLAPKEEDEEESLLTDEQLLLLAESKDIKDMVSNPELQRILKELDSAVNPEQALDRALERAPILQEFADTALGIVLEPRQTT